MLIAKIHITLKEEVSDPQGMTVKSSLTRIGINNLHSVAGGTINLTQFELLISYLFSG